MLKWRLNSPKGQNDESTKSHPELLKWLVTRREAKADIDTRNYVPFMSQLQINVIFLFEFTFQVNILKGIHL